MDSAEQPRPGGHTYLGDPENAAEMARLLLQDQLVTSGMGGVLAEQTALSSWQRVLDIACGPGGWASGLAKQYPHLSVTGVDVSQQMINFAQVQAHREGIGNVHFEVMNVLEPLTF